MSTINVILVAKGVGVTLHMMVMSPIFCDVIHSSKCDPLTQASSGVIIAPSASVLTPLISGEPDMVGGGVHELPNTGGVRGLME